MDDSNNDLTYREVMERRMDARIKECRKRERRLLKELGVGKLPKELEDRIYERLTLETWRKYVQDHPEHHDMVLSLLGSVFATFASQPQKGR